MFERLQKQTDFDKIFTKKLRIISNQSLQGNFKCAIWKSNVVNHKS